jgi:hypothetical protein
VSYSSQFMKKAIALFFILLLMETMGYAQSFLYEKPAPRSPVEVASLFPDLSDSPRFDNNNTCLIGSSNLRTYADQMDKPSLTDQDSFLQAYKNEQNKNLVPSYFRDSNFKSYIKRDQIYCAMKRIPNVSQTKKVCSKSSEQGQFHKQTPCVTDQMVDYIYWGLNEAMRCYSDLIDSHERKILFKKINHESAFGFFFQYNGGTGIEQLIQGSQKDMFIDGHAGNSFLMAHINKNKNSCENFLNLVNRTAKTKNLQSCEFISIGDGIGRSLLGGIGLYLHYRSDPENPYSAEKLLEYWGVYKSDTEEYKQIRSYITLGMYNVGPGAVLDGIKKSIRAKSLAKKSDSETFKIVMALIKRSSFNNYIRGVETNNNQIFDKKGDCKI